MSDIPAGWAELLVRPLGPEPPEETPLAVLPCLFPEPGEGVPAVLREPPPAEE